MAKNKSTRRAKRATSTPTSTAAPRRRDYRAKTRVVDVPGFASLLAIKDTLPAVAPPPVPRLCWDEPAPGKW